MKPTCAHCGFRDATEEDHLEGRPAPACKPCLAEVDQPDTAPTEEIDEFTPGRVLGAVRDMGEPTLGDIAEEFGADPGDARYTRLRRVLVQLVADGAVTLTRERGRRGKYRATEAA